MNEHNKYNGLRFLLTSVFSLFMFFSLWSCSGDPSPKEAEGLLMDKFHNSIEIYSIRETNAKQGEIQGVKTYEMLFEARVKFLDDLIINSSYVKKGKLSVYDALAYGIQGLREEEALVVGSMLFEDTKKGWVVANISLDGVENLSAKYYHGIWLYDSDENGVKKYIRIWALENNKYMFETGYKEDKRDDYMLVNWWANKVKNSDNIYLRFSNGKLQGEFVSTNFNNAHGGEVQYEVTLEPIDKKRMSYNIRSSNVKGYERKEAVKVADDYYW